MKSVSRITDGCVAEEAKGRSRVARVREGEEPVDDRDAVGEAEIGVDRDLGSLVEQDGNQPTRQRKIRVFGIMGARTYHTVQGAAIEARGRVVVPQNQRSKRRSSQPPRARCAAVVARGVGALLPRRARTSRPRGRSRAARCLRRSTRTRGAGNRRAPRRRSPDRSRLGARTTAARTRRAPRRRWRPPESAVQIGTASCAARQLHVARVVEADPDDRHELGREADEPGVLRVVAGAGLARDRPGDAGRRDGAPRAAIDDPLEQRHARDSWRRHRCTRSLEPALAVERAARAVDSGRRRSARSGRSPPFASVA